MFHLVVGWWWIVPLLDANIHVHPTSIYRKMVDYICENMESWVYWLLCHRIAGAKELKIQSPTTTFWNLETIFQKISYIKLSLIVFSWFLPVFSYNDIVRVHNIEYRVPYVSKFLLFSLISTDLVWFLRLFHWVCVYIIKSSSCGKFV